MNFPEDINELREELFACSRRLGQLKQELARRQREARAKVNAEFEKMLHEFINNPDAAMNRKIEP